jgi:hypothetical protein
MAEWFEPKRYGYGAGLPISWQGWVIMILYVALVVGSALLFVRLKLILFFAIVVPATMALLVIAARTTRGGWRWRWGGKE